MQIDIPPAEQQKLINLARSAGFDDVQAYVTEHVMSLAHFGLQEFAPLTDDELEASLAMCDQGMAEARAGNSRPVDEALARNRERLKQLRP